MCKSRLPDFAISSNILSLILQTPLKSKCQVTSNERVLAFILFLNLAFFVRKICFIGINILEHKEDRLLISVMDFLWTIVQTPVMDIINFYKWSILFLDQSGGQRSWLSVRGWGLPLSSVWSAWRILCASLRLSSDASGKREITEIGESSIQSSGIFNAMYIFTPLLPHYLDMKSES